jgi:hypothetical protein
MTAGEKLTRARALTRQLHGLYKVRLAILRHGRPMYGWHLGDLEAFIGELEELHKAVCS